MCSGAKGPSVGCWFCDPSSGHGPIGCLEGSRHPWGSLDPLLPRGLLG